MKYFASQVMCLLLDVLHRNWKKNVSQNSIHKLNLNNKKTRSDCVFRCQQRSWISNTYVKRTTKPIWLTRNKSMIWFFVNEWLLKWLKEYIFFWKDEFTTEWYQTHAKRKQKKSQHCPSSNKNSGYFGIQVKQRQMRENTAVVEGEGGGGGINESKN